jgi:hypothetical protein
MPAHKPISGEQNTQNYSEESFLGIFFSAAAEVERR